MIYFICGLIWILNGLINIFLHGEMSLAFTQMVLGIVLIQIDNNLYRFKYNEKDVDRLEDMLNSRIDVSNQRIENNYKYIEAIINELIKYQEVRQHEMSKMRKKRAKKKEKQRRRR